MWVDYVDDSCSNCRSGLGQFEPVADSIHVNYLIHLARNMQVSSDC